MRQCDITRSTCANDTVLPLEGYYYIAALDRYSECPTGTCGQGNTCTGNRVGELCADCMPGHSLVHGRCVPCTGFSTGVFLLNVAAMLATVCYCLYFMAVASARFSVIIFFAQAMALLTMGNPHLSASVSLWRIAFLDFEWVPNACLAPMSYYQRYVLKLVVPLVPMLLMLAVLWQVERWLHGSALVKRLRRSWLVEHLRRHEVSQLTKFLRYRQAVFATMYLSYIPMVVNILSVFYCREIYTFEDADGETQLSTKRILLADTEVVCVYDDGQVGGDLTLSVEGAARAGMCAVWFACGALSATLVCVTQRATFNPPLPEYFPLCPGHSPLVCLRWTRSMPPSGR